LTGQVNSFSFGETFKLNTMKPRLLLILSFLCGNLLFSQNDPTFDFVLPLDNGGYQVASKDLWTILDKDRKPFAQWDWYSSIASPAEGLVLVRKGNQYGYTDLNGRIVIPIQYDRAASFSQGLANVWLGKQSLWINYSGKTVIVEAVPAADAPIPIPGRFNEYGLMTISKWVDLPIISMEKGKLPSINMDQYASLTNQERRYIVKKTLHYGLMDRSGKIILPVEYDVVGEFHSGFATVQRGDKVGLVNQDGKIVIELNYHGISILDNGYLLLQKNQHMALAKTSGEIIIPFGTYHSISLEPNGMLNVRKGIRRGLVDFQGRVLFPLKHRNLGTLGEDLVRVGKYKIYLIRINSGVYLGWADVKRNKFIRIKYAEAGNFDQGVAPFKISKKGWGLIGENGQFVLPLSPTLEELRDFKYGLARAKSEGKWGWIDHSGKMSIAAQFDLSRSFYGQLAPVNVQKKWGLIDASGEWVMPAFFKDVHAIENGFFMATLDEEHEFIVDQNGKALFAGSQYQKIL
jgi:WG containing repeat